MKLLSAALAKEKSKKKCKKKGQRGKKKDKPCHFTHNISC